MLSRGFASRHPGVVGYGSGVPYQRSFRMCDQKACYRHLHCRDLFLLKSEASYVGEMKDSAIKHVQPGGMWRLHLVVERMKLFAHFL